MISQNVIQGPVSLIKIGLKLSASSNVLKMSFSDTIILYHALLALTLRYLQASCYFRAMKIGNDIKQTKK